MLQSVQNAFTSTDLPALWTIRTCMVGMHSATEDVATWPHPLITPQGNCLASSPYFDPIVFRVVRVAMLHRGHSPVQVYVFNTKLWGNQVRWGLLCPSNRGQLSCRASRSGVAHLSHQLPKEEHRPAKAEKEKPPDDGGFVKKGERHAVICRNFTLAQLHLRCNRNRSIANSLVHTFFRLPKGRLERPWNQIHQLTITLQSDHNRRVGEGACRLAATLSFPLDPRSNT
jgi:hypothetical protein